MNVSYLGACPLEIVFNSTSTVVSEVELEGIGYEGVSLLIVNFALLAACCVIANAIFCSDLFKTTDVMDRDIVERGQLITEIEQVIAEREQLRDLRPQNIAEREQLRAELEQVRELRDLRDLRNQLDARVANLAARLVLGALNGALRAPVFPSLCDVRSPGSCLSCFTRPVR